MNEMLNDGVEQYDEGGSRLPSWLSETPYWLIAVALHVVILFILGWNQYLWPLLITKIGRAHV